MKLNSETVTHHIIVRGVVLPVEIREQPALTGKRRLYQAVCAYGGVTVESEFWPGFEKAKSQLRGLAEDALRVPILREREIAKLAAWNAGLPKR